MNLLSPFLRLEVGGTEVFHDHREPVLLVATPSAPLDAWLISAAVPASRRWTLRRAHGDTVVQRAQLAAGNTLLAISLEPWVGELAVSAGVPVVPVGVRGAYAVGEWSDMVRRRIPSSSERPRVAVRFGPALSLPDDPTAAREAMDEAGARLVLEDETTWWDALRSTRATSDAEANPRSWRDRWERTGPTPRGGPVTRRRIWR